MRRVLGGPERSFRVAASAEPPSVAQGGRGVLVLGYSHCRKRIQTVGAFVDHLVDEVMPKILVAASE